MECERCHGFFPIRRRRGHMRKRNMAKQHLTITLNLEPSRQFDMIARCLGYVRTGDPSADDLANLNRQIEALGINFDERSDEDEGRDQ